MLAVDVPMHISFGPSKAARMHRIMSHEVPIKHVLPFNLLEELEIPFNLSMVVVAQHKPLMTIKPPKKTRGRLHVLRFSAQHGYIAKVVNMILRPHGFVPALDYVLIHLFDSLKFGTYMRSVLT